MLAVANAYELVFPHVRPYGNLSALARADEVHFAQKASLWLTPYGHPELVICTCPPSIPIVDALRADLSAVIRTPYTRHYSPRI